MTLFSLYSKPEAGPEALEAIGERFVWTAFLFPPLWALVLGLWRLLALWLLVVAALYGLRPLLGADAVFGLYALFALWCGFAAPGFRTAALGRKGYLGHGDLVAPNAEAAESVWLSKRYGARA